ncbi:MAG: HAMP domain-containing sensor histidine kinase [Arachidicoccus sp.]|nr:HAMP domain-containing sensor histidine kinase [Arachidicoccus sp.]
MTKNIKLLLALCIMAMLGILLLQFYWMKKYYATTLFQFVQKVNICFDDAVKKEAEIRYDTIQQLLIQQMLDTSQFIISSAWNKHRKEYDFYVTSKKHLKDKFNFGLIGFNKEVKQSDTAYKRKIAIRFSGMIHREDFENHVVYYRTQDLGEFELSQAKKFDFDTTRLKPILVANLAKQQIHTSFQFYFGKSGNISDDPTLNNKVKKSYVVITNALPTYTWNTKSKTHVRAIFNNPFSYVISQMKWIFISSVLLIILVGTCMYLLAKALLREKQLSAMKNDFINNMTHEFKTPIATVSAAVEALSDFDVNAEKSRRYLDLSKNELQRLNGLVNNILNITLYENASKELNKTIVNIKETIDDIMNALMLQSVKKIHYSFESHSETQAINADKELFNQALRNILDNSIKYAKDEVNILITCLQKDDFIEIIISDNGIGISSSALPKIFDKFYREPGKGHSVKGHGLGLNYVKEIIEMHSGTVEVKSIKEKGTIVFLKLPL